MGNNKKYLILKKNAIRFSFIYFFGFKICFFFFCNFLSSILFSYDLNNPNEASTTSSFDLKKS